jgi:hypothetical protein
VFALLTACSPAAEISPASTLALPTAAIIDRATAAPAEASEAAATENAEVAPAAWPERTRYTIEVNMAGVSTLHASAEVDYLNTTGQTLETLPFVLYAPVEWYRIESVLGGAPSFSPIRDYTLSNGLLQVPLNAPLEPGERTTLTLYYQLSTPPRGLSGYAQRQAHFVYWYPFVPPTDTNGNWLIHTAGDVGEHIPQEQADFDVIVRVDNPALQIIAPGAVSVMDTGARVELRNARHMMFTLSSELIFSEETINGVLVRSWYYPEHEEAGLQALAVAGEALALYGDLLAPYPYDSLILMEGYINDGLEGDAGFFLDAFYYNAYDGTPQNYLTALTAHEVAHAWFYGMVGNDPALEPWLDEALATYLEYLYYESYHPELADWWWAWRIDPYPVGGWVNSTIYDHREFRGYVGAVYFRGARFLHALRGELGDETFFAFLRAYAESNRDALATRADFFYLLGQFTHADLSALIDFYFTPWR